MHEPIVLISYKDIIGETACREQLKFLQKSYKNNGFFKKQILKFKYKRGWLNDVFLSEWCNKNR